MYNKYKFVGDHKGKRVAGGDTLASKAPRFCSRNRTCEGNRTRKRENRQKPEGKGKDPSVRRVGKGKEESTRNRC